MKYKADKTYITIKCLIVLTYINKIGELIMKKNVIAVMLIAVTVANLISGCNNFANKVETSLEVTVVESVEKENTDTSNVDTIIFIDSVGREVELPKNITRVAASGSVAQMIIYSLAPEMLVGITSEWDDNQLEYIVEEYQNLPKIGQFYSSGNLNLEEIVSLEPQVVIDIGETKKSISEDMDSLTLQTDIPTIHIEATAKNMAEAYRMLGKILGKEEEADILAKYCERVYTDTIGIANKAEVDGSKKTMIYCLLETGNNVIVKGTFHAEIIDMLAENIAVVDDPSSRGSGNEVGMEQIIAWDPEVIVFQNESIYDIAKTDKIWQELTAIKNNTYYEVPFSPHNWLGFPPSINRYIGMIWLAETLYPEIAEYDLKEEVKTFYKLFYHIDITDEQFEELTKKAIK
jgi:ABC-type Fe3+-hydroxamate transport system, periplasmic component